MSVKQEFDPTQEDIPAAIGRCTDRTIIEARFFLTGLNLALVSQGEYVEGKWQQQPSTLGGTVVMSAAKHGVFGKATPSGNLSMMIQNPYAFEVFKNAFERVGRELHRSPRFRVYFVEDENQEPDSY